LNVKWEQVKELLNSALEQPAEEREAFLRESCGGDESLLAEVESLLTAYNSEKSSPPKAEAPYEFPNLIEEKIGQYKVIRQIGSGGMGTVYLAARSDDTFQKRVAIKVVQSAVDAGEISRRFQRERQILAALDHPSIARLFDGGTTQHGVPYFVMEYVEGIRIDHYCDRHRLSVRERIALFRQVCGAVQYVHQNLVVHRDLKPGNILITADGLPKLLDFGIAKLLKPELFATALDVTRADFPLMTPAYASPEQIRGEPINVASDVYSLGVILFELLTSRRPYRLKSGSQHEILNAICDQEPDKPSGVITRIGREEEKPEQATIELLAQLRATIPQKLCRQLRGELDNIILKALRKEPQQRYASVEQFSEDLRRHLQGLPVSAHRDSWHYRSVKFIGRHKAGVAATGLVFASLLAGVFGTAWQAKIARQQRAEAQNNFQDVRRLATSFLFEIHNAIQNLPGSTPARQLVVQRALEYLSRLAEKSRSDPGLQRELAEAYLKVGDVQGNPYAANLGDAAEAATSYSKALDISKALVQANSGDAAARLDLARSYRLLGQVLPVLGRPTDAVSDLRSAAQIYESLNPKDFNGSEMQTELAQCYQVMGDTLGHGGMQNLGDETGAFAAYQKALAIDEALATAHPDNKSAQTGIPLLEIRIGDLQHDDDKLASSLNYYRQALDRLTALSFSDAHTGDYQWLLALGYRKIGAVEDDMGNNAEALKNYLKAAGIDQQQVDADPTNVRASMSLAISLRYAGELTEKTGNVAGALKYNRRVIQLFEKLSPANSNNVVLRGRYAEILIDTAEQLMKRHELTEARHLATRGLALDRDLAQRSDVTSDDLAQYALDLLNCEPEDLREPATALRYAEQSVAKSESSYSLDVLARAYFQNGDRARAVSTEERALSLLPATEKPGSVSPLRTKITAQLGKFRATLAPVTTASRKAASPN